MNSNERIIGAFIQVCPDTGSIRQVQVMANSSDETDLICGALLELFKKIAGEKLVEPILSHNNGKSRICAVKKM
jgi:hypothetical protein